MKKRMGQYLNQDVIWRHKIGVDGFGKPVYEDKKIFVRKQKKERSVTDVRGKEFVSQNQFFCQSPVGLGDVLDGDEVLGVRELVNRRGVTVGYEVLT